MTRHDIYIIIIGDDEGEAFFISQLITFFYEIWNFRWLPNFQIRNVANLIDI